MVPYGQGACRRRLPAEHQVLSAARHGPPIAGQRARGGRAVAGLARAQWVVLCRHAQDLRAGLSVRPHACADGHERNAARGHRRQRVDPAVGPRDRPTPARRRGDRAADRGRHRNDQPADASRRQHRRRGAGGGWSAASGGPVGAGGSPASGVDEQPEADRPGDAHVP